MGMQGRMYKSYRWFHTWWIRGVTTILMILSALYVGVWTWLTPWRYNPGFEATTWLVVDTRMWPDTSAQRSVYRAPIHTFVENYTGSLSQELGIAMYDGDYYVWIAPTRDYAAIRDYIGGIGTILYDSDERKGVSPVQAWNALHKMEPGATCIRYSSPHSPGTSDMPTACKSLVGT